MTSPVLGNIQFAVADSNSVTIARPTDVVSGKLLLAYLATSSSWASGTGGSLTDSTFAPLVDLPSGFTALDRPTGSRAVIAWKVAGSSEPATYLFGGHGGAVTHVALMCISGVNASNPIAAQTPGAAGTGTYISMTAPASSLAMLFAQWDDETVALAAPGGSWTVVFDHNGSIDGSGTRLQLATQAFASLGTTGTPTAAGTVDNVTTMGLVIAGNSAPPAITSSTTASGTQGVSFSYTITGSNTPTSYAATGLPTGLSVNTSTGAITGTPTVNGVFSVGISVTNSAGTGNATLTLTIVSSEPVISSNFFASGTQDQGFTYSITATNTPTSYGATGLPTGLTLNSSTGAITGTPTVFGPYQATMTATNTFGSDTEPLVITIAPASAGPMAAERWRLRGDAVPVAQVTDIVIPEGQGAIEIEINGKAATFESPTATSIATAWAAGGGVLSEPEFAALLPTASGSTLTLTASEPGKPFAIGRISLGGANPSNEVQRYTISNAPTGGTYTITLLGQTTSGIAFNATAADVQSALEALPSVIPGDVLVVQPTSGVPTYELRFSGVLAGTAIPAITVDRANLTGGTAALRVDPIRDGAVPVNEVQSITLPGNTNGGTFTLSYAGQTTGNIAYNASNATIQTALQGLSTIGSGNATVSGGTLPTAPINVTFTGTLAATNVAAITGDGTNLVSASNPVATATVGGPTSPSLAPQHEFTINDIQSTVPRWAFRFEGPIAAANGFSYSPLLALNATAAQIKTALVGLQIWYVTQRATNASSYRQREAHTLTADDLTVTGSIALNQTITIQFVSDKLKNHVLPGPWYLELANTSGNVLHSYESPGTLAGTTYTNSLFALGREFSVANATNTAGQFKLRLPLLPSGTVDTASISARATASQIVTAVNTAYGSRIVEARQADESKTLGGDTIKIVYANYGYQVASLATVQVIGDLVTVTTTTQGFAGVSEEQSLRLTNSPWGGTVTVNAAGGTTSALNYNATASQVQTALQAITAIGSGNAIAEGGPWPAEISVSFAASLGNVALMAVGTNALRNAVVTVTEPVVGGVTITPRNRTRSRGVNHWNDPLTWQNDLGQPGVPGFGDTAVCDATRTDLLHGLRQRCVFTADAAADELVLADPDLFAVGQRVRLRTTGTLPSGLSTSTDYYIVDASDRRVRLATSRGGAVVALASAGSGTHTIEVVLAVLRLRSTWTGKLGLPAINATDSVRELLPQYLELGASEIEIGAGEGSGQQRIKIDVGPTQTACTVIATSGSADAGLKAMMLIGSNVNNTLEVVSGDVAVAYYANESAALAKLTQRGGSVYLGRGVTLGTLDKTSGTLLADGAVLDGAVNIRG